MTRSWFWFDKREDAEELPPMRLCPSPGCGRPFFPRRRNQDACEPWCRYWRQKRGIDPSRYWKPGRPIKERMGNAS